MYYSIISLTYEEVVDIITERFGSLGRDATDTREIFYSGGWYMRALFESEETESESWDYYISEENDRSTEIWGQWCLVDTTDDEDSLKRNFYYDEELIDVHRYHAVRERDRCVATEVYNKYHSSVPKSYKPLGSRQFTKLLLKVFSNVKSIRTCVGGNNNRVTIYQGLKEIGLKSKDTRDDHSYSLSSKVVAPSDVKLCVEDIDGLSDDDMETDIDFDNDDDDSDYVPYESNDEETGTTKLPGVDWKQFLPVELASKDDWLHFFTQQIANASTHKRWSVSMIQTLIDIWTRSPTAYRNLRKVLILPSEKHLQRYKNFINQKSGIVHENLHWMLLEAKRRMLSTRGRSGCLVFDEVSIQEDVQFFSSAEDTELVGMTDYGKAQGMHMLRKFGGVHVLATHILQFVFLGHTGFKWPVAYFATTEAHACELMTLVWQVVNVLRTYDFTVDGILMDGSANNRKFLKLHYQPSSLQENMCPDFHIQNPIYGGHFVTVVMDPMHGIKKIRNSDLASTEVSEIRRLRYGREFSYWSHWENAYEWDRMTNLLAVHNKLTDEHIYVTDTGKMRNHLATDVMNEEMLNLMQEYQLATGRKDLGLTIKILKNMSVITRNFLSDRPISKADDSVFAENRTALEFFDDWYKATKHDSRCFISKEAYEDLTSTVLGFEYLAKKRLQEHPGCRIVASIVNSDVIENLFSSQRGRCNGANTNPTALTYGKNLNTIIMTSERQRSSKRNASSNESVGGAYPYNVLAGAVFKR